MTTTALVRQVPFRRPERGSGHVDGNGDDEKDTLRRVGRKQKERILEFRLSEPTLGVPQEPCPWVTDIRRRLSDLISDLNIDLHGKVSHGV
jgi:hypothetical protein